MFDATVQMGGGKGCQNSLALLIDFLGGNDAQTEGHFTLGSLVLSRRIRTRTPRPQGFPKRRAIMKS